MKTRQLQKRMEEVSNLLEEGYTTREISSMLGLGYSTVARYRTILDSKKTKETIQTLEIDNNDTKVCGELLETQHTNKLLETQYTVDFLNGSYEIIGRVVDDGIMLSYSDFSTALELEGYEVNCIESSKTISDEYITTTGLIYVANEINDYVFTNWLKNKLFVEDVFSKYYNIINNLKKVDDLIQDISEHYSAVSSYNLKQQDILHEIEDATEDYELLKLSKELLKLRKIRRVESNEIALAKQMRESLGNQRIHSRGMCEVANRLEGVLKDLKEGKYIQRSSEESYEENIDETL